ncbi:MAG: hypothetical protein A3H98_10035 [Bacteroidetes bacterium RIFCSPLOWO2_02_FULL_36_8]|nr:MAG: hypothetical protein A3H98_10035 [Bacteroidetes bacterium RIFCSPLOWO2_02_FULL_36_8]OFY70396.1 MAG: hypothetical protein A3G23_09730 [Bacteroidetes bacterium RIFCSPLOWO2_12_FULL_37_12]
MKLFLDNLRGFNNCFIDINQVNFLVGENSTGKSSFLSILSLFSDTQFNFSGEFRNSFVNFGLFEDIINKNSSNNETFHIGFIKNGKQTLLDSNFTYDSLLLVFKEKDGFPNISTILCRAKTSFLKVEVGKTELNYSLFSVNTSLYSDKQLFSDIIINKEFELKNIIDNGNVSIKGISGELLRYIINDIGNIPFMFRFSEHSIKETEIDKKRKLYSDFRKNQRMLFPRERNLLGNTIWIDPIRSKPQPLYQPTDKQYSAEGEHIPTILRDIFDDKESPNSKSIIRLLESFGNASGLFDKIYISKLQKQKKNSPFEINFSLHGNTIKISNIGYGVSQILPILTEIARNPKESIFFIQQAEVHLHPRSQAFFGEFIFTQFKEENKSFFIETHSDYVIDRFRLLIRKSKSEEIHKKVNFLFFESNKDNTVTTISIDKNGDYGEGQPENFRNFFLKEELDILGFSD